MDLTARVEALETQVRELRDQEEIRHLLSTYAFNADLGRLDEFIQGWTPEGVYDVAEGMLFPDRAAIHAFVSDESGPRGMLENNSQHLVANLVIKVEGDRAWAEGYSIVTLAAEGGVRIFAAGYNHWDFERSEGRWLMALRLRRTIGGPTWGGEVLKSYLD